MPARQRAVALPGTPAQRVLEGQMVRVRASTLKPDKGVVCARSGRSGTGKRLPASTPAVVVVVVVGQAANDGTSVVVHHIRDGSNASER